MSHDSKRGNNNLQIRDVRPEELGQVSQLLKEAYQQYEDSVPAPVWQPYLQDVMDVRSRLDNAELIVADLNEQLAGSVTLYLKASDSEQEGWPEGWAGIRLLAVHPLFRNRGIGKALIEECIRRCRRHGITTIGLHTSKIMDVARRLYERMGFVRVPELDFHPIPEVTVMAFRLDF